MITPTQLAQWLAAHPRVSGFQPEPITPAMVLLVRARIGPTVGWYVRDRGSLVRWESEASLVARGVVVPLERTPESWT